MQRSHWTVRTWFILAGAVALIANGVVITVFLTGRNSLPNLISAPTVTPIISPTTSTLTINSQPSTPTPTVILREE